MDVLAGVRVVEMGLWVAGPAAGGVLADWGAEVVKIEPPSGDPMRGLFGALSGSKEQRCPPFDLYNRGKSSVALDINTPEGRDLAEQIVADADVFLTNMRPAFLERVGLGHERLLEKHPRLVYATLTGYGLVGPDRDAPGFDVAAFGARAGVSDRCTPPGQPPTTLPGGLGDAVTGMSLVAGVLAALLHRERTGRGQLVEVPMLETLAAFVSVEHLGGLAFDPPLGGAGYERLRHRKPVRTRDGWITLLPYTAAHWRAFLTAGGRPELIAALGVEDAPTRNANIDRVYAAMAEIALTRTTAEWLALCEELDVPATAFSRLEEVPEHPHLQAVGMFQTMQHPSEGRIRYARPPTRFAETPASVHRHPPRLGEHTAEILAELGYDAAAVRELAAQGAVKLGG